MRDLVRSTSYRLRKALDDTLFRVFPKSWIPLYNSVSFTHMPYSQCVKNREWQNKVSAYARANVAHIHPKLIGKLPEFSLLPQVLSRMMLLGASAVCVPAVSVAVGLLAKYLRNWRKWHRIVCMCFCSVKSHFSYFRPAQPGTTHTCSTFVPEQINKKPFCGLFGWIACYWIACSSWCAYTTC